MFVGCSHSNDAAHRQWPVLKAKWANFLQHKNSKKHVFIEGWLRPMQGDEEDVIKNHGDGGFINLLVQKAGVEHSCEEPNRSEEAHYLRGLFTPQEVLAYYFARQLEAWARGGRLSCPSWETWVEQGMWKWSDG